mgnify:CR=1 FL=1
MYSKRVLLILLLLVFAVACFAGGQKEGAASAEKAAKITVVVHSGHHATPWYDEKPNLKKEFGVDLNVIEVSPNELYSRVFMELQQKTGAYDLVQYNSAWVGDFSQYLMPLDSYIEQDNDAIGFDDILPAFKDYQCNWGGKRMAISVDGDTFLMYYRKDLFTHPEEREAFRAEYGYELPDPPETWAQVTDLAEFFTRKKGETLGGSTLTKDFYGYADQAKGFWIVTRP